MQITNVVNVVGNGVAIQRTVQRTVEGVGGREVTLPAAKAGTLTTRTSASVGTLTMSGGHGITTGMTVDLYWDGGSRYQVLVGTVSGNSVPFTIGTGFDLPAQDTAVVICEQQQINIGIDADNLSLFAMEVSYADQAEDANIIARIDDESATPLTQLRLTANLPIVLDAVGNNGSENPGVNNPFIGLSDTMWITHSSTSAGTLKLIWAVDATP